MLSTCCVFPLITNIVLVDNKGPIVRFTENLKLSIYSGCCDVQWQNTYYFPKVKALLQSKPLSCRMKSRGEGKPEFTHYRGGLTKACTCI